MSVVLRHTRHSRLNYPNLYSYQRIHRRSRKISKREPLFYSILKHKNPPFSSSVLRVSIFFRAKLLAFFGTVIVGYYSRYSRSVETGAPSWGIPSHKRSRITYISPRICWRARIRTIEPGQNNSQE